MQDGNGQRQLPGALGGWGWGEPVPQARESHNEAVLRGCGISEARVGNNISLFLKTCGGEIKKHSKNMWQRGCETPGGNLCPRGLTGGAVGDFHSAVCAGMLQILLNIEMSILVS